MQYVSYTPLSYSKVHEVSLRLGNAARMRRRGPALPCAAAAAVAVSQVETQRRSAGAATGGAEDIKLH